jgi:hypothetical protein
VQNSCSPSSQPDLLGARHGQAKKHRMTPPTERQAAGPPAASASRPDDALGAHTMRKSPTTHLLGRPQGRQTRLLASPAQRLAALLVLLPILAIAQPSYYCNSYAGSPGSVCPICTPGQACAVSAAAPPPLLARALSAATATALCCHTSPPHPHPTPPSHPRPVTLTHSPSTPRPAPQSIATADSFWRNPTICSLPDTPENRAIPGASLVPSTSICSGPLGINSFPVRGLPGSSLANTTVGRAYVWIGYNARLYVTLVFNCNYMFSTNPNLPRPVVAIAVANAANLLNRPQYIGELGHQSESDVGLVAEIEVKIGTPERTRACMGELRREGGLARGGHCRAVPREEPAARIVCTCAAPGCPRQQPARQPRTGADCLRTAAPSARALGASRRAA